MSDISESDVRIAIEFLIGEVKRARGDKRYSEEATLLYKLGWGYDEIGEYGESQKCHVRALSICRDLHDLHGQMMNLHLLGVANKNLRDMKAALQYFTETLAMARQLPDRPHEAMSLSEIPHQPRFGDVDRAPGGKPGIFAGLNRDGCARLRRH